MKQLQLEKSLAGRILDVGGGGEGVIGRLYGRQVTAVDCSQEELDEAPGGFEKICVDATALPFPAKSFDHVTFFYSLMYMRSEEQAKAIEEAMRVVKPGGSISIWDCEITSAYPEPFLAELEILLPKEHISVTYGVLKQDPQGLRSVSELCLRLGAALEASEEDGGHFFLRCRRPLRADTPSGTP